MKNLTTLLILLIFKNAKMFRFKDLRLRPLFTATHLRTIKYFWRVLVVNDGLPVHVPGPAVHDPVHTNKQQTNKQTHLSTGVCCLGN